MEPALLAVVVVLFAGASFFFALAETALFSLSKWQAQQLAERNPTAGGIVVRLLGEAQDLLATMVLGNTFASAAMLAVGLWMALNGRWPLALTVAVLFLLILIGCEVIPKTLAVRRPELVSISKSNRLSTVHRRVPLDTVAVKTFDAQGKVTGLRLFIGLFTSTAYSRSARLIPLLKAYKDGGLLLRDDHLALYGDRVPAPGGGTLVPLLDALTGDLIKGADGWKMVSIYSHDPSKALTCSAN